MASEVFHTFVESDIHSCRFDYYLLETAEHFCHPARTVYSLFVTEAAEGTVVDHILLYDIGQDLCRLRTLLCDLAQGQADLIASAEAVQDFLCEA